MRGFTLLELMIGVAIVGILAAISYGQYEIHVRKARATDAVTYISRMRGDFHAEFGARGDFPLEVAGSKSKKAAKQLKLPKVKNKEFKIKTPDSDLVKEYWYDWDTKRDEAWIGISFREERFPGCKKKCAVHLGFTRTGGGQVTEFCGRWTAAKSWGDFPLELLPATCRESCVYCEIKKLR